MPPRKSGPAHERGAEPASLPTYLFLWNPRKDPTSFRDYGRIVAEARRGRPYVTRWRCPSRKPAVDDAVYVQRTGPSANGVFAWGRVVGGPSESETGAFVVLELSEFLDEGVSITRNEVLARLDGSIEWAAPQASGTRLPAGIGAALTSLWAEKLAPEHQSVERFVFGLRALVPTERQLEILRVHYRAPGRTVTIHEVATQVGAARHQRINVDYGKLARDFGRVVGRHNPTQVYLGTLVDLEKRAGTWHWIMRPQLARALERVGWVEPMATSLTPRPSASAWDPDAAALEGEPRLLTHLRRERNPRITRHKLASVRDADGMVRCEACDFVPKLHYPAMSTDLVEVHHRCPLSEVDGSVETRLEDLAVLCPNCHRAIHAIRPMPSVGAFRELIRRTKGA